jgi:hypothetical protein
MKILLIAGVLWIATVSARASGAADQSPGSLPQKEAAAGAAEKFRLSPESQIEIVLKPSRHQITAGSGFGIAGDIRNRSAAPVYVVPKYVVLTPPPEINPGGNIGWYAQITAPGKEELSYDPIFDYGRVVEIAPGDRVSAVWVLGSGSSVGSEPSGKGKGLQQLSNWLVNRLHLMNFSPGEYTVKVSAVYWQDQKSAEVREKNYRYEVAEAQVVVGAPQWVVLTGAVIGGIIAYFLLPAVRLVPGKIEWKGLLTSGLVSAIVTILIARLSETQFLIRVTINDLWGAIAIGFIASSSGSSILQKYAFHPLPSDTASPPPPGSSASQDGAA